MLAVRISVPARDWFYGNENDVWLDVTFQIDVIAWLTKQAKHDQTGYMST